MTEDEIYRTSSQYKLWSFTKTNLAELRATTNSAAAESVRIATQSLRRGQTKDGTNGASRSDPTATDIDCLTVEEEMKLVQFYCLRAIEFSDFCQFPTVVKATAIQYLKRFYLFNSPMTYHPKEIMPCALYLATKTENHYQSLRSFSAKLDKTTAEDVIAPEFLLTQGLRFTFDVRHPQRGLEGGYMELMAMINGESQSTHNEDLNGNDVQEKLLNIRPAQEGTPHTDTVSKTKNRIQKAHDRAVEILKTAALLSDAYFLYTPSQIWLASFMCADKPLAESFVDIKISQSSNLGQKLLRVLGDCAALLMSSISAQPDESEMKELIRIDKKLFKCRNPEKIDLVAINKAQKRDAEAQNGNALDEKVIKKRKLERINSMKDGEDLFGPSIPAQN